MRIFAFENALRETLSSPHLPEEQKIQDGFVTAARSNLTQEQFELACREGAAMSMEQAIQDAV